MITITTMDGREVATLRDRDGIVSARQIRACDSRSPLVAVGDSILSPGRYLWHRDGVRVTPAALDGYSYVLRSQAAAELGRIGGQSKSAKKAEAARKNGQRGGRPSVNR